MKTTTIYTNGKSLFTLDNYDKTSAVSHANGITIYSEVSIRVAKSMHEKGSITYIQGIGDRKELKDVIITRKSKFNNFICS